LSFCIRYLETALKNSLLWMTHWKNLEQQWIVKNSR